MNITKGLFIYHTPSSLEKGKICQLDIYKGQISPLPTDISSK